MLPHNYDVFIPFLNSGFVIRVCMVDFIMHFDISYRITNVRNTQAFYVGIIPPELSQKKTIYFSIRYTIPPCHETKIRDIGRFADSSHRGWLES